MTDHKEKKENWWLYRNQFACRQKDRSNWKSYAQVVSLFLLTIVLLWLVSMMVKK